MDVVHPVCVGMDISKTDAKVCVRVQGDHGRASQEVTTWGATSRQILELADDLAGRRVTCVVMEATGDYWKPFYLLMEAAGLPVMLVNARQARQIPGRKTDVNDAMWLADLAAHGLLHASFVPPADIRELKDLVRARTTMTRLRTQEIQRLEKLLESAAIKLSSVISSLNSVSGRRMLEALIDGERDPNTLAGLADGRLKATPEQLSEALTGRFTDHHGFLARLHLDMIDEYTAKIDLLTQRIDVYFADQSGDDTSTVMTPAQARDLLVTIPGLSDTSAQQVIAEIGTDMSRFPTPAHLASWAGVAPGANESAGKTKSTKCRPGDTYLKGTLGICARSLIKADDTFFAARYRRVLARRGKPVALVALMRTILEAVWHVLTTQQPYQDLGADYYTRRRPGSAISAALARLRDAGCTIQVTPNGILINQT